MGADPETGNGMDRIEGEIAIGRPVDVVFDYVADQSNEPQYNPRMVRAEKITPGPVRTGTRFRSAVASRGRTAEMLIECTGYERPRLLASTTTMAQADISYTLTFEPTPTGTRMRWSGQVRPKGAFRLLGPVITWLGIRQEQRIWTSLKKQLEAALQPTA
jgi:Polyketide cyclase / dehydrase and lipid transport